jgi:hypothetical protein
MAEEQASPKPAMWFVAGDLLETLENFLVDQSRVPFSIQLESAYHAIVQLGF